MKKFIVYFTFILSGICSVLTAESRTLQETEARVVEWMKGRSELAHHTIQSGELFTLEGLDSCLHIFRLQPGGYIVANAESELPLILAFSSTSVLSLTETDTNTLRSFLSTYLQSIPDRYPEASLPQPMTLFEASPQSSVYVAPMLTTAWNQTDPYNTLMPDVGEVRAPVGSVATAYAQILNYHHWPVRGTGSETYTDDSSLGFSGTFTATFDTVYDWKNMLPVYIPAGGNPPEAETAVSQLMWDLVVAKHADIEADNTFANPLFLGQQLAKSHYMEVPSEVSGPTAIDLLQAELENGFPAVVTIPGHAVVVDGINNGGGNTLLHIQYGWGGSNDGWFAAAAIPNGALQTVLVGIRPALMPFPQQPVTSTPVNQSVSLPWILPRTRNSEVQALRLYQMEDRTDPVSLKLTESLHVIALDWNQVTDATRGEVWFAGPYGPATLDFSERFVPSASSRLEFTMQYQLGTATLSVEVSTDGGNTFTSIYSVNENDTLNWDSHDVSLSDYAGQTVQIRFYLSSGSDYPSTGGVWLDTLSVTYPQSWTRWSFWKQVDNLNVQSFSSNLQLLDEADDFTTFESTSTDTFFDWKIAAAEGGNGFYKEDDGFSDLEYHLTSTSTITPQPNTRLLLRARYVFNKGYFRVLASNNLTSWTELADFHGSIPWSDLIVDLSPYAGQPIYVRLEYVSNNGFYIENGGIWIERIQLETLTHPELEGQPLHLSDVSAFGLPEGLYQIAATAVDGSNTEHRLSPAFTLELTAPETSRGTLHSWLTTYGGIDPAAGDESFELADLDDSVDPNFPLWQHFVAGTTPGNPLTVEAITTDGSSVTLQWTAQPGRVYQLLRTQDLTLPREQWTICGSVNGTEADQLLEFQDTPSPSAPWFYTLDVSEVPE